MSALARLFTRTRIEGLVILLVAAGFLWEGHNVPDLYKMPGVPGPTVFPLLLGIVFALAGAWLILSPGSRTDGEAAADDDRATGGLWGHLHINWHTGVMWGVILLYLFVMPDLGFPVATTLLLVAFFVLLGERRWYMVGALAVGTTLVIQLGFSLGLNVRLPLGVLAPLFK